MTKRTKFYVLCGDVSRFWADAEEVEAFNAADAIHQSNDYAAMEDYALAGESPRAIFFVADNPRGEGAKAYRASVRIERHHECAKDTTIKPPTTWTDEEE